MKLRFGDGIAALGRVPGTFPLYVPEREIDFGLLPPVDRFEVLGQRLLTEPVASDPRRVVVDLVVRG